MDAAAVDRSVWSANLCSYALLFIVACVWLGWKPYRGGEKAPPLKRVLQENPIDVAYLHNVAIPSSDPASRPRLVKSVAQLEVYLADFKSFMHDVEEGGLVVRKTSVWVVGNRLFRGLIAG